MEKRAFGEVKIASDVVAAIAALAATEVDGIDSMAYGIKSGFANKFGRNNLSKGVRVTMEGNSVHVGLLIIVKYGYSIPKISEQVQERVVFQIETMTGLEVVSVNVRVSGVVPGY